MTVREQLIKAIETLPESQVAQVLTYVNQVKADEGKTPEKDSNSQPSFDDNWWNNLSEFTPDFLEVREQPQLPAREDIFE
ncbi:MAG: hypothetical protein EA395_03540 [Phormidium sp. GEM2.Bin31]|nr:hypothetical protein [Phormidium sp. BM_Day4_Bin.17]TVR13822.1 MAG: hypothetical protein EA395_03540 [Phormidium sp. GEM2.Bin31]UCJ10525.1 MAG: hypothetical protein JWS08_11720 [Phormidium sp. PBR-2020]